jgi:hypothetical protein
VRLGALPDGEPRFREACRPRSRRGGADRRWVGAAGCTRPSTAAFKSLVRTCSVASPDALAMATSVPADALSLRVPSKISFTRG